MIKTFKSMQYSKWANLHVRSAEFVVSIYSFNIKGEICNM